MCARRDDRQASSQRERRNAFAARNVNASTSVRAGFVLSGAIALVCLLSLTSALAADLFAPPRQQHTRPLAPAYEIFDDGSAAIAVCYNASCAQRTRVTLGKTDFADVERHLAVCAEGGLHNRLQRVRIAVWRMEALVERQLPALANDLPVNHDEFGVDGRTDCVDNATNTTTYLQVLRDLGMFSDWTIDTPRIRQRFNIERVHWTATIIDSESGTRWTVDSWYRPNGHLPFVMEFESWRAEKLGWEEPFARLNRTPEDSRELCTQS